MKKILMFFGGQTPVKAEKTYYLDVNGCPRWQLGS